MEIALITMQQTFVMFLLMLAGYMMFRKGLITQEGSKTLANILVWLVIPAVLIQSFHGKYSLENLHNLMLSTIVAVIALCLAMVISATVFRKEPIANFAAAFSNAGFIGIPLVTAVLGEYSVFFITAYIALLNILQWTYGSRVLTGQIGSFRLKKLLCSPIVIGAFTGLMLFFTHITLPVVITKTLSFVTGLNTPLAMLILGIYLAQSDFKSLFNEPKLYAVCGVRLLLIPLLTIAVLWVLPLPAVMRMALLIVASAPVGANVAVYSQLHGLDYTYACKTITLSTILSIFTLPLLIWITGVLFM